MNKRHHAVALTLLNILLPGAGSVVGGKVTMGSKQLVLTAVAGLLLYLGVPMYQALLTSVAAVLWAFTTSLEFLMKEYDK